MSHSPQPADASLQLVNFGPHVVNFCSKWGRRVRHRSLEPQRGAFGRIFMVGVRHYRGRWIKGESGGGVRPHNNSPRRPPNSRPPHSHGTGASIKHLAARGIRRLTYRCGCGSLHARAAAIARGGDKENLLDETEKRSKILRIGDEIAKTQMSPFMRIEVVIQERKAHKVLGLGESKGILFDLLWLSLSSSSNVCLPDSIVRPIDFQLRHTSNFRTVFIGLSGMNIQQFLKLDCLLQLSSENGLPSNTRGIVVTIIEIPSRPNPHIAIAPSSRI
ncbi:hypothetical protein BD779DRAFT_1474517 [Infundibulicybe gibba]|nr:hypothetical protein BD779DRAFT_1474517 [Infundibulicybe gibba]